MKHTQLLVRAATALAGDQPPATLPELPLDAWQKCLRSAELLTVAVSRRWQRASDVCRRDLAYRLDQVRWQVEALRAELAEPAPPHRATAREIYDDLMALEDEFACMRVDLKSKEFTVTTAPITLEGVALGPFEIVLDGQNLASGSPYRVVALEPACPDADDSVTHPHVRDEQLCEGEASGAIRTALAQRRLLDFFTIVAQTLATYNSSSAYTRLDEWTGITCRECGDHCSSDDSANCHRCGGDLCDSCGDCCDACDQLFCHDCAGPCHGCERTVCSGCVRRCHDCNQSYCKECLDDGLCPDCQPAADEGDLVPASEPDDDENSAAPATDPPLHADGVGQAHMPA
jgi:hypothetical protein